MSNRTIIFTIVSAFILIIGTLFGVTVTYGAPISSIFGNILPISNNVFDIGTSTAKFNRGFFNWASTTAVSIFSQLDIGGTSTTTIIGNAGTSTFSGGITLTTGCFRDLSGSCVTSGALSGGTAGWLTYWTSATAVSATSSPSVASLTTGYLTATSTTDSTFAGLLSVTGAGTSTFTNGLSAGGLSSSNGITVTGGGANFPAGSISNTELENSSLTLTTTSPLGGGGAISLGGSLTFTCSTCVTSVTASGNIASSGGTTPAITFTGTLPIANGGTNNTAFSPGMVIVSGASSLNATSSLLTVGQLNATTTATSTFAGGLSVLTINASSASATSTFSNGIQLAGGCFRDINGSCLTAGGAGTPGGSDGQIQYNNGGAFGGATFFFLDDNNSRIGIATTTPNVSFVMGSSTPAYNPEVVEPWRATVTINLNTGNHFKVILAGATTLTLSNGWAGQSADVTLCQDSTGGRTVTNYTNPILWPGATTTLSETANKCNLLSILVSSGTTTSNYLVTGLITGY